MTRLPVVAALVAATLALAGCGGSDSSSPAKEDAGVSGLSARQLVAAAQKQLDAAETVTVKGSGSDDEGTKLDIDLTYAKETASGSVAVDGLEFTFRQVGEKLFLKPSDEFFRQSAGDAAQQVIDVIDGRWILVEKGDPNFGEVASFLDRDEFLGTAIDPDGTVKKGAEKRVGGVDCIAVTDDSDGTLYLDRRDGRPVSIVSDDEGTVKFRYDAVKEAEEPTAGEVVSSSELSG